MSELRSVLDQMAAVADENLTVEELASDIVELTHAGQILDVLVARKTREIADRRGHVEMGYPSPTAFLMDQARMSAGHAKQVVSRANATGTAPVAFAAWADGRLSTDQTRHLFQLAEAVPDAFQAAEEALVRIIEPLSVRESTNVLQYWRQSVDGPGELDPEIELARRGLSVSKTLGGMRRIDGWLTALAGEALEASLNALMPPPGPDDARTARQRRHDALEDLSRAWLDHGDTPVVGGEKPHISVIADLPALQGIAGGLHETLNGHILDVDAIRRLACDCSVSRIVLGPDSEVLDIGRKTRVWTPAQRRAIIARDRHCTWPGCETRPEWCDIHHVEHWADGGSTSVEKGKLLCRFHHTREHMEEGRRRRMRN
ncbi:MAG: DUF222 domain-containing protein [Acidimicrobiia bacterium]